MDWGINTQCNASEFNGRTGNLLAMFKLFDSVPIRTKNGQRSERENKEAEL